MLTNLFWFVTFWLRVIFKNAARKMLMKLTTGGNPLEQASQTQTTLRAAKATKTAEVAAKF